MKIQVLDRECTPNEVRAGDAGIDLKARKDYCFKPYNTHKMPTGIKVAIPEGHVGLIFARSGYGSRGFILRNGTGVIDSNYRGEIFVPMINTAESIFEIKKGHRIAQMVIVPIFNPVFELVDELNETNRGKDGFGSSGE